MLNYKDASFVVSVPFHSKPGMVLMADTSCATNTVILLYCCATSAYIVVLFPGSVSTYLDMWDLSGFCYLCVDIPFSPVNLLLNVCVGRCI